MLFFLKLNRPHCGKMLTVTSVPSCDSRKFENNTATEHQQVRKRNSGKLLAILCRLIALLLALAVAAPVLLAEEEDHEPGKGNDLTGVWTQKLIGGSDIGDIIFLVTFHRDGTALVDQQGDVVFDPVQSTQQGLWKKVGARAFISTFLQLEYNKDASLYGIAKHQTLYTLYPSGDQYDCTLVVTETLVDGTVNHYPKPGDPPLKFHGVRLTLEPPPL